MSKETRYLIVATLKSGVLLYFLKYPAHNYLNFVWVNDPKHATHFASLSGAQAEIHRQKIISGVEIRKQETKVEILNV
jgi:hypothetical protein